MAPRASLFACALLVVAAAAAAPAAPTTPVFDLGSSWTPTGEWFMKWMSEGGEVVTGMEDVGEMRTMLIRRVKKWAVAEMTDSKHDVSGRGRGGVVDTA